jgi:hypothetical protein
MTTSALTRIGFALVVLVATAAFSTPAQAAYHWPVKPFDREHPIRGSFGDPRTVFFGPPTRDTLLRGEGDFQFHFGVDISAPNGTPVYPVQSGLVTRVTDEEIDVAGAGGLAFQYWHLRAAVRTGERVTASVTVLGRIMKPCGHVHLTELDHGVIVNPLQRGHLTPYTDRTKPEVTSIVRRGSELLATAIDMPSTPVPGAWHDLPVTPALVEWRVVDRAGRDVEPTRVVYDVREHLPAQSTFWSVYARGTHQNMTTFTHFYAYRQPGVYLFRLGDVTLRPGTYRVIVTAVDIRGNHGSREQQLVVGRPLTGTPARASNQRSCCVGCSS